MTDREFLAFLVIDGALVGAIYALVALAFVVVYKASRMINFAVGDLTMLASRLVASGLYALGLPLGGALALGGAGMVAVGVAFSAVVLRRLFGQPLISLIMVTIGLGLFLRGAAAIAFAGIPAGIQLPVPFDPLVIRGVPVSTDKLVAAAAAGVCIAALSWFFHGSRTGLALRAIANDQQVAMAVGIDLHRHFAITWGLAGVLSVLAGTLWTFVTGGGSGSSSSGSRCSRSSFSAGSTASPARSSAPSSWACWRAWRRAGSIPSWGAASAASPRTWCSWPRSSCVRTGSSGEPRSSASEPPVLHMRQADR
jgi:branched-chain amino acid transport system permease protein